MAKQIYIDENGNPIEVSGTINNASMLPISANDSTDTKTYIDTGLSGFNWLGAGDFTLSSGTTSLTLTKDMTNIKEIYFGLYLSVGSIGARIRKSLTIPVYELKNVGVFFDEMLTQNDRVYFQVDYTDSTHLAISSVSLPAGYTFGLKVYVR